MSYSITAIWQATYIFINLMLLCCECVQIKLDTSLCVDNLLPQIASQYEQMRETFKQVDQLEVVVQKVNKSVTAMEAEVNAAESHLGSESVLKSIMRPFLVYSHPFYYFFSYILWNHLIFITYYFQPKAMSSNNHPTAPSQTTPPSYKPVDIFNSDQLFDQDNNTTSANQSWSNIYYFF